MVGLFKDFFANRSLFFDQFNGAAKNVVEMASLLQSVVNTPDGNERLLIFKRINKKENTGDEITHKINRYLNKIVFTPLNRNDIHVLASAIDDVADAIEEATNRMNLYNTGANEFAAPVKEIAAIILKSCFEIERAIDLLSLPKKTDEVIGLCRQIKNYARQSAQVYCHAVATLFSDEKDPIELLKYREILHALETAVNKCKNVTDVLNTISIYNR